MRKEEAETVNKGGGNYISDGRTCTSILPNMTQSHKMKNTPNVRRCLLKWGPDLWDNKWTAVKHRPRSSVELGRHCL